MDWSSDAYRIDILFPSRGTPLEVIDGILSILQQHGNAYTPTRALVPGYGKGLFRSIVVGPGDALSVLRLGARYMDEARGTYSQIGVELLNPPKSEVDLDLRSGYLDRVKISLNREIVPDERAVDEFLGVACELRALLWPTMGLIEDYQVTRQDPPIRLAILAGGFQLHVGIYWANFWGPEVVELLGGLDCVKLAPAHQVRVFGDGGVLLMSAPSLLTYDSQADRAHRQAIWEYFALDQRHERAYKNALETWRWEREQLQKIQAAKARSSSGQETSTGVG